MRSTHKPIIWTLAALTALVLLAAYFFWPRRTLADDAEDALLAWWRGDGSTLHGFLYEEEVKAFKLTPEKIDRLHQEVFKPAFASAKGFRIISKKTTRNTMAPSQGICRGEVLMPSGDRFSLTSVANDTGQGGRISLSRKLASAWVYTYRTKNPKAPYSQANNIRARLIGLERDRPLLERLGIWGQFIIQRPSTPMPWDEYKREIEQMLPTASNEVTKG
jgi:hypothetical protein